MGKAWASSCGGCSAVVRGRGSQVESMASCRKMLIEILNYSGFIRDDRVSYPQCSGQLGEDMAEGTAEDLKATIAELDTKIESTIRTVASQGQSIVDLEKAFKFNAGRIDELEKLCTSLQDSVQRLSVKVVDLEGRSRRHNLRVVGLADGVEPGSRPTDFFAKLLKDAMGSDVLASDPQLDRAHRALVPVPRPGQRPRPIIISCHSFKTKDLILREARMRGNLLHKGHPFHVYEDYAPDVAKHRAGYRDVMTKLYKLHLRPALLFPARLRITPPSGEKIWGCPRFWMQRSLYGNIRQSPVQVRVPCHCVLGSAHGLEPILYHNG
uniref:L1 transposable element RRM domain-containing protein n=1 Tax=Salmo trutta TaxID=8032 RepID=A0A674A137_SALTR